MMLRHRRSAAFAAALLAVLALAGPVAAEPVTVSITIRVTGLTGKYVPYGVVRDHYGRRCTSTCTYDYPAGSSVSFDVPWTDVATVAALGSCGAETSCLVAADATPTFDVVFAPVTTQTIVLYVYGASSGYSISPPVPSARVLSNVMPPCDPGPIRYGIPEPCVVTVPTFSTVLFAAQTDTSSDLFNGWSGINACLNAEQICSFVADSSPEVSAFFSVNALMVIVDCDRLGLRDFNCIDDQLHVVVSSPNTGTVGSEVGVNGDCRGNLAEQCGFSMAFPFGEPVHIEFRTPEDKQLRIEGPCAPTARSCDIVLNGGAYFRLTYMPGSPGTPANPRVVAGDGQITVVWDTPDPPGIGPITYTVSEQATRRIVEGSSPLVIDGLSNFSHYFVDVKASNQYGTSVATRTFEVVPIPAPTSFAVPWEANDLARIDTMAAYLDTDRSGVQRQAVYLTAFLVSLDRSAPPTPASLPLRSDDEVRVTSDWQYSELSVPTTVQDRFVLDGIDAHRFSVYLLSYLLGLSGH